MSAKLPLDDNRSFFKLYRSTSVAKDEGLYVGSIVTPEGRTYFVEARVVEAEGKRHFEGKLFTAQMAQKKLFRGGRFTGDKRALPPEHAALIDPELNDQLPPIEAGAGS